MDIYLLQADRPLTKTYTQQQDGSVTGNSYPNAYEFTSHKVSAHSLVQLVNAINKAAKLGQCLLKGALSRPLVAESRAGSTDATALTELGVFDLDGAPYTTPDDFMAAIGLGEVSYVVQFSASSGFKPGLRCHIFVLLERPTSPAVLKQYCQWKNLTVPELAGALNLTRTGVALRYPLDITANQNDKLIYLSPPVLAGGLLDPHPANTRVQLINKPLQKWLVPATPTPESIRMMVQDKITDLRKRAHLPEKKFSASKMAGGVEYLPNPGEAAVTGTRVDRGFVYLNLNGGDSWGYWYPENSPEFLYNFKGEPTYKLSELCPTYWSSIQQQTNSGSANSFGMTYLGICDRKSGAYHKVTYDNHADQLTVEPARSKEQVKDFLKQHGQPVRDVIADWSLTWDPKNTLRIDVPNKMVNMYEPSEYMKRPAKPVAHCPPTIKRILLNVMGDDEICVDHFFNWTAFIIQFKGRTNTAWVWFGGQGTGKGVTFHMILSLIFGRHNVVAKRMEELEGEFTGFMENKFLVFVDEVQVSRSAWHQKVTAKLKNLIAEPWISVRKMYMEAYMAPNYSNMIFASNMRDPLEIAPDDRRFNIAPFQKNAIKLTEQDFQNIEAELTDFYNFLMTYAVNEARARTPYQNQERQDLIETSMLSVDVVSKAINSGNIEFFLDQLPQNDTPGPQRLNLSDRDLKLIAYKELLRDIVNTGRKHLSRDDLFTLFGYCVEDVPQSPNKFTSYLRHHDIRMEAVWNGTKTVRGILVKWQISPATVAAASQCLS